MQGGILCISFTGGGDVSRFGSRSVRHCIAPERLSYGRYARRDRMIRMALFVVAGLALAVPAAWAQSTAPESDDSRYTFNRIDDGYLRLDGRTGQVSICARHPVGWTCQAVPDERAALEAEIARLQGENIAIKKELLARNLPLPGTVKPEPPAAKPEEPRLQLPNDADLDKVMNFIEKIWRRLVEMIATLQKDMLKKT
jgi:hypothetical protein